MCQNKSTGFIGKRKASEEIYKYNESFSNQPKELKLLLCE